jgi:hydrogenase nickel incorporation protein HypB
MIVLQGYDENKKADFDESRLIELEEDILQRNNKIAEKNRSYLKTKKIVCLNLMSSPGSGKTTLLEETIKMLKGKKEVYVIEGDQQTTNDADRIAALDIPVLQINTGYDCHLEASMIERALEQLNPTERSLVFIENVGNLICPAAFDLGESQKVVVISTTEGDDKPLKYPYMFQEANICIINKIDLSPYLNSNVALLRENCLRVNPHLRIFEISALKNTGMDNWLNFLIDKD